VDNGGQTHHRLVLSKAQLSGCGLIVAKWALVLSQILLFKDFSVKAAETSCFDLQLTPPRYMTRSWRQCQASQPICVSGTHQGDGRDDLTVRAQIGATPAAQPPWLNKRFAPDFIAASLCEAAKSRLARGMLGAVCAARDVAFGSMLSKKAK
jgi:hypothetical protein